MTAAAPRIAAVVPVHDGLEYTRRFLQSMREVTYPALEVVVVDDGSTDGTAAAVMQEFPGVTVLKGDGNLWWSGGTNVGAEHALNAGADFILTINNDVAVAPDFLDRLVACALDNPGAIVGGKIYFAHDPERIWFAGGELSWKNGKMLVNIGHNRLDSREFCTRRRVDFLTGMCVLIPAEVFCRIGFYDRENFPQYHADSEFTLRARAAGIPILMEPEAKVWNQTESTYMQRFVRSRKLDLTAVRELLTSFRSPMNLRLYWLMHRRFCPPLLLPLAFTLRLARVAVFLVKIKISQLRGGDALERIGT